jgi:fungal type III polyketide synthase
VLTPRVPKLTQAALPSTFADLVASLPSLPLSYQTAPDFDWAMHPGGATILTGAEKAMSITPEHMRASYDTYINHGNSSSATIFSVMDRLRAKDMDALAPGGRVRDYVVGCAFGPGISVEMCLLKRNTGGGGITGLQTPPETESEGSRSEAGDDLAATRDWDADTAKDGGAADAPGLKALEPTPSLAPTARVDEHRFIAEALEALDLD